MKIAWTPKSLRSFKRLIRKNPQLSIAIATLESIRRVGRENQSD